MRQGIYRSADGGTVFAGREAVDVYRTMALSRALMFYAKYGRPLGRAWTPVKMLRVAAGLTGHTYKRGEYTLAAMDLRKLCNKPLNDGAVTDAERAANG